MTADSAAASSAASTASSSSSIPPPATTRSPGGPTSTKRRVDPIAAVQDSIDGLALSLFEALRGVRDAVVVSASAVVDDNSANTSSATAFLSDSSSSGEHHHHRTMTTTMAATGDDVDDAMAAARSRLLNGLNVGYFTSRAYDALEPDYESFLLSYLADDPHARELVEMMSSSSSSSTTTSAVTADGKDPSVEVVRSSKTPASLEEKVSSASTSLSSSSSSSSSDVENATSGSARNDIGEVGYEFRKEFSSGWFVGRVVEIRPLAANGYDRRCVYSDGDIEDLRLVDLEHLARIDPNNDIAPGGNVAVANKRPRLTIKLNASRRPTSTDDDDDGNGARGGGVGGCSSRDRAAAGFPRTREEYIALLRGAERLRDANTTRRLAEDVLSRSRAVDDLVAKLPGMGRTRDVQMERIAMLIRDNHRVMAELRMAHDTARARREEVRSALSENTCLALGLEYGDS